MEVMLASAIKAIKGSESLIAFGGAINALAAKSLPAQCRRANWHRPVHSRADRGAADRMADREVDGVASVNAFDTGPRVLVASDPKVDQGL